MLEYHRSDISERIRINKTNASKLHDICHYWYFLDKNFKYEPYLSNGCHDYMKKAMSFNDVAIVSVKGSIPSNSFLVYEKKWCNKYNENLKWKKWITINFFIFI